jgi:hypothetical protein
MIQIPVGDNIRNGYFTDPVPNVSKYIYVINIDRVVEYDDTTEVIIDISNEKWVDTSISRSTAIEPSSRLQFIHDAIEIKGGKMCGKNNIQIPHQNMLVQYLTGYEKVLEVGGNIGRNALIIAHILNKIGNQQFVTVEYNKNHIYFLKKNKELNNLQFYIEESMLSNNQFIENINTITFTELEKKYNIRFDTLVLDCDYMSYFFLMETANILDGIKLIIMTNDYTNIIDKNRMDDHLQKHHFYLSCVESGNTRNFYEVWKKE